MICDRQINRLAHAFERVRKTEQDTLADLVAALNDRDAAKFAALEHERRGVDVAVRELAAAGSALAERVRLTSCAQEPRGRTPTPDLRMTGEGSASPSAHCPTNCGRST